MRGSSNDIVKVFKDDILTTEVISLTESSSAISLKTTC